MRSYDWISNGDPPIYVWPGDVWYNQKTKKDYLAVISTRTWVKFLFYDCEDDDQIPFPKKTIVMAAIGSK